LKNRYDFFKYFSISAIIAKRRDKYYKAIKDVEDYDNDVTYFLLYSSDVVSKSIDEITDKIIKKYQTNIISKKLDDKGMYLNKRQRKIIKFAIEDNLRTVTTRRYQKIFKVSYGTARSDLNEIVEHGLFKKRKVGKGFVYQAGIKDFLR
jgi:Fic family protein